MNKAKFDITEIKLLLSKKFPFLTDTDLELFLSISQYKSFKNKEIIFREGSTSRKSAFILSGVTRGYFTAKDDVEKNLMIRVEGTFMGLPEWLYDNKPTKYNFEAILDCDLLIFNIAEIEDLAKKNTGIFDLYAWALKEMILITLYRIESMVTMTPEERYKDLLAKYPLFFQKAFNKHIANFLGITPVSLSRIIKRLKDTSI